MSCAFGLVAAVLAAVSPTGPHPVAVTVLEGVPDTLDWPTAKARETDRFAEPAFAVVGTPAQYSPRAIPLDRPVPFVLRADADVTLPAGTHTLVLRSKAGARLLVDGKVVAALVSPKKSGDGHQAVPPVVPPHDPAAPVLGPGQREAVAEVSFDGKPHAVRLEVVVGNGGLRPEVGQTVVTVTRDGEPSRLLSPTPSVPYTPVAWSRYVEVARERLVQQNAKTRVAVSAADRAYWDQRHDAARREWAAKPRPPVPSVLGAGTDIDRFLLAALPAGTKPGPGVDDLAFLRRVFLDTVGVPPTPDEIAAFRADQSPNRRANAIDRLLADPRWADHWVSYWQDVLGENPGLLKPTLNNTGPFRGWLHTALLDNLPADRFATELVRMDGSKMYGGPAGFSVAAEIDVPMAAKATILARAFLAADLQCARCHDAPGKSSFKQEQLFAFAALLDRKPIKVPATSTVPPQPGGRKPAVRSRLKVGQEIPPDWLLDELAADDDGGPTDPRDKLAEVLTGPDNDRFPKVIVNRVWARFFGWGLVDPIDDWADADVRFPGLLDHLAHELVAGGYDVKHVARLILASDAYQRVPAADAAKSAAPARRRLSAEQLLDSLFAVAGKRFDCGELTFDAEGRQGLSSCVNLGEPRRAWELIGLSGERDRPALALPMAQPLVDLMVTYGWRESRAGSVTTRDDPTTPLQPMALANGLVTARVTRLSDDSAFTELALADRPLSELVEGLTVRVLGRLPTRAEATALTELLAEGYAGRRVDAPVNDPPPPPRVVSWSHHLSPEATDIKLVAERVVRAGDPPTRRLTADWRKRMEDAVWALVNSPEFVFVP